MTKRAASLLVLAIAGAWLAAALPQNTQKDWKEYAYNGDGFAVSAPSEPVMTKQEKETPTGNVEVHNYAIELGNNSGVMLSSAEIKGAEGVDPKLLLQNAKTGAVTAMNAKITTEKEITLETNPGVQFEAESENFHVRARMYMIKGKLLTLLAVAPATTAIPANADRIFASLKLLKPAAPK